MLTEFAVLLLLHTHFALASSGRSGYNGSRRVSAWQSDLHHCVSMSLVRVLCAGQRNDEGIRVSALLSFILNAPGMRASLLLSFLACCFFIGTAHATSCMIHEEEGKAMLCYHKSPDGRCMYYGPVCQTKVVPAAIAKLPPPVALQPASAAQENKKQLTALVPAS
jgi:hypothetical protein